MNYESLNDMDSDDDKISSSLELEYFEAVES